MGYRCFDKTDRIVWDTDASINLCVLRGADVTNGLSDTLRAMGDGGEAASVCNGAPHLSPPSLISSHTRAIVDDVMS